MNKILNLKLVIRWVYQNIKAILPKKIALQTGLKNLLQLKELKILCRGHMLLIISTVQKLLKGLTKKKGAKNKTKRAWSQKNDKEKRR